MEKKMKKEDEKDFVFQQKKIDNQNINKLDEFYSITGDQDYYDENNNPRLLNDDSKKTLAKKLFTEDNKPKYLIKVSTDGKFFNPLNILKQRMVGSFLDRKYRQPKFKSVSNKVFNMYLNFLKSKNLSWLYNADREAE